MSCGLCIIVGIERILLWRMMYMPVLYDDEGNVSYDGGSKWEREQVYTTIKDVIDYMVEPVIGDEWASDFDLLEIAHEAFDYDPSVDGLVQVVDDDEFWDIVKNNPGHGEKSIFDYKDEDE